MENILIEGEWQESTSVASYQATNPATGQALTAKFPISDWLTCDRVLDAAREASRELQNTNPSRIVVFLRYYAELLEQSVEELAEIASTETALPVHPRLADVELPRTIGQLRAAANAAKTDQWRDIVVDEDNGLVSGLGPMGPVLVLGPNNFPFAFNAVSGGDFAAAIAAGNPVIAKSHPDHPNTTFALAKLANQAANEAELPPATLQVLWGMENESGLRVASDPRLGAVAFTGSRRAGLALKQAADGAGKPFYAEMSSVNPVFVLPAALRQRGTQIAEEYAASVLLGVGQFCTCPNLAVLPSGDGADTFLQSVVDQFKEKPAGTLLSQRVQDDLAAAVGRLQAAGAKTLCGGIKSEAQISAFENTLMQVDVESFLNNPEALQTEGFGPLSLVVTVDEPPQWIDVCKAIEGSLTASVYFESSGDGELASELTNAARWIAGRVIHNKMPTGVAVSPAMNHGGPFPASGHPGFTAVGLPAAMRRFAKLDCYDNLDPQYLPCWFESAEIGVESVG